jgi:hypothetical protein
VKVEPLKDFETSAKSEKFQVFPSLILMNQMSIYVRRKAGGKKAK